MSRIDSSAGLLQRCVGLLVLACLTLTICGCGNSEGEAVNSDTSEGGLTTLTTPYGWQLEYDAEFFEFSRIESGDWIYTFEHEYEDDRSEIRLVLHTVTDKTQLTPDQLECVDDAPGYNLECIALDESTTIRVLKNLFIDQYGTNEMQQTVRDDWESKAQSLLDSIHLVPEVEIPDLSGQGHLDTASGTYESSAGWSASWDPEVWESWSDCPYGYANCDNFVGLKGGSITYEYVDGPKVYGITLNLEAPDEQNASRSDEERITACVQSLQPVEEGDWEVDSQGVNWILYRILEPIDTSKYYYKQCRIAGETVVSIFGQLTSKGYQERAWSQVNQIEILPTGQNSTPES